MPPRKEAKQAINYPASKRKAPPFKPPRPSKAPRVSTAASGSSGEATKPPERTRAHAIAISDSEDDEEGAAFDSLTRDTQGRDDGDTEGDEDSDEDLADDPLTARPAKKRAPPARTAATTTTTTTRATSFRSAHEALPARKSTLRDPSPSSESSREDAHDPQPRGPTVKPTTTATTIPALSDATSPSIPTPLLLRLLHENFRHPDTRIDQHALQVVRTYVEIFVREAIARTALMKREAAERGEVVGEMEAAWLELADLEKVAPGMLLDF